MTTEIETESSPEIMIVDDTPANLHLLSGILRKANYKVRPANSGELALRSAFARPPSIFLLDVRMADMDGFELCRRLKADNRTRSAPVIFISALGETNDKVEGFRAGGVDYITKPFFAEEVLARVEAHISLRRSQIALERRNEEFAAAEIALRDATAREMELAASIQRSLLLGDPPTRLPGTELAFMTRPSREIGGDFYDVFRISENVFDLLIADVMGKGVPAAFVAAATKAAFQRVTDREDSWSGKTLTPPNLIVEGVGSLISAQLGKLDSFVTLNYARVDLIARTITVVNCGHPPMIQGHHASGELEEIEGEESNPGLGLFSKISLKQKTIPFAAGDMLLFYSDGVTDARNESRELFGRDRFLRFLKKHAWGKPGPVLDAVEKELRSFSGPVRFYDDFTMVVVHFDDPLPDL